MNNLKIKIKQIIRYVQEKHLVNKKLIKKLTKAESLKFLNKYSGDRFIIPEFLYISLKNFFKNENDFIKTIQKKFKKKKIIIRSSALDEDALNKSNAGKYLSLKSKANNKDEIL